MPVLRSAKSKRLLPPLEKDRVTRSMYSFSTKSSLSRTTIKLEPAGSVSNTDINDIRKVLQNDPSDAKFYSDICEEELKKLMKEREFLNIKIQEMCDASKGREAKDTEAAKIVKKLWEEANKKCLLPKQGKLNKGKVIRKLGPGDVKRIFEEAKKLSNHLKLRKKLLLARKQRLESKIHLAIDTIKFCRKFVTDTKI